MTWRPNSHLAVVHARADRLGSAADADFRADALPAQSSILVDAIGRQHLVVKSDTRRATVSIRGAAVAVAPVRLTFEMTTLAGLFAAQDNVALLQELLEDPPAGVSDWSVSGLEKRDALIALDARSHGASHRDVAIIIAGSKQVEAEWIGDGCELKDYVRRRRTAGVAYTQGGYRRLLR